MEKSRIASMMRAYLSQMEVNFNVDDRIYKTIMETVSLPHGDHCIYIYIVYITEVKSEQPTRKLRL